MTLPPTLVPALGWVRSDLLDEKTPPATLSGPFKDDVAVSDDELLTLTPRMHWLDPSRLIPLVVAASLVLGYAGTALLWPSSAAVNPPSTTAPLATAAPSAQIAWPANGSAGVTVDGLGSMLVSHDDAVPMASLTQLVTALLVLEKAPLAGDATGPSYAMTSADQRLSRTLRNRGETALNVPVGGSLTERQLLEGMLIASASNYAERLATELWGSESAFVAAATSWLNAHGISGMTVVDSSGIDSGNTATPDALLAVNRLALAQPVIAQIVAMRSTTLPGVGEVANTNALLADAGLVGTKADAGNHSVLSAKRVSIDGQDVIVGAVVLGQRSDAQSADASRALLSQLSSELSSSVAVTAGTPVGTITTAWGASVPIVVAQDVTVIGWNGSTPGISLQLGDTTRSEKGEKVGTLTATGPLNTTTVDLVLGAQLAGPSAWWRLTHPLTLLGWR